MVFSLNPTYGLAVGDARWDLYRGDLLSGLAIAFVVHSLDLTDSCFRGMPPPPSEHAVSEW